MRIDLVLASGVVSERVKAAWVDRQAARKGTGPNCHAPVIVDLDEAPTATSVRLPAALGARRDARAP